MNRRISATPATPAPDLANSRAGSDGSGAAQDVDSLIVELRASGPGPDAVTRLRGGLKDLLRRHGLRARWPAPEAVAAVARWDDVPPLPEADCGPGCDTRAAPEAA
jgi:hypothetical protein